MIVPAGEEQPPGLPVFRYVTFETEIGRFLVTRSDRGLKSVRFARDLDVERELKRLTHGRRAVAVEDRLSLRRVVDGIRDYLSGHEASFDVSLDLTELTPFSRSVLEAVRGIPYGKLRTYKWVAAAIGRPRATRPVGQALSRNPLPIIIPCHRVVQSDGAIGGYSGGGPDMKRRLIGIETGQIGLALGASEHEARRRIRFLLESEAGDRETT